MFDEARHVYAQSLSDIRAAGLYKEERVITPPQAAFIRTATPRPWIRRRRATF